MTKDQEIPEDIKEIFESMFGKVEEVLGDLGPKVKSIESTKTEEN